ncbi:MAG: GTPase [Naasia sp.]|nr:GTPase [Naasia sp.]
MTARRARGKAHPAADLVGRVDALDAALELGSDALDPAGVVAARDIVRKVQERTRLSGQHTVVALAGATGSGKSSLFNALVGADVARTGARRPTTSRPTAAVWGGADAGALLDWLRVDSRHLVDGAHGGADGGTALDGLVLLDLPDFDSREADHRLEAERALGLVDVFVWVTDPQKYADARLHDDFVAVLSAHESVTLAVLNQADRLPADAVAACAADLGRLLARDGLPGATVLTTSVATGAGIDALRARIGEVVAGHAAARRRLSADVGTIARALAAGVADGETNSELLPTSDVDSALARAAGVPVVLDAVARDYRRQAVAASGWLFTRWIRRVRPDPLRRLGLERAPARRDADDGGDVSAALRRSSISAPTGSATAAVEVATRSYGRAAAAGLPPRWANLVEDAATDGDASLLDALDQAVTGTSVAARRPLWWGLWNLLQWLAGLAAVAGLLWLAGLYVLGLLALPRPETPSVGVVPVPLLLLVGGVLLGILLAGLARWLARVGSRRRRRLIAGRLRQSVAGVRKERITAPVTAVLARHRTTREQLSRAAR